MGVFVPCPKVAEVSMVFECLGEVCENVYHVLGTAEWTHASLVTLGTAFNGWGVLQLGDLQHDACQFQRLYMRALYAQDGPIAQQDADPISDGVQAGPFPNHVTCAISWRTGLAGRSNRGRTFHIGLWESAVAGNEVTPTARAALLACYNGLQPLLSPVNGGELVVLSRRHNNAYRAAGVATPITTVSLNPEIDSQRRRLPGHNRHR